MSRFLTFLTVCVVLAIFRAALAALAVGLGIILLYSFITRPRETLVFFGTLTLFGLASVKPIACIVAIALLVVAAAAWQKSRRPLLLTDQSEQHSPASNPLDRDPPG